MASHFVLQVAERTNAKVVQKVGCKSHIVLINVFYYSYIQSARGFLSIKINVHGKHIGFNADCVG